MAAKKSEESTSPEEAAPEQSVYESGEWVDATVDGENPPIGDLVWYATPGGDPEVRLGRWDGQTYTEEATGRSSTDAEVTGYKELMSEAPADPGFKAPEPEPEPQEAPPLQSEPAPKSASV